MRLIIWLTHDFSRGARTWLILAPPPINWWRGERTSAFLRPLKWSVNLKRESPRFNEFLFVTLQDLYYNNFRNRFNILNFEFVSDFGLRISDFNLGGISIVVVRVLPKDKAPVQFWYPAPKILTPFNSNTL